MSAISGADAATESPEIRFCISGIDVGDVLKARVAQPPSAVGFLRSGFRTSRPLRPLRQIVSQSALIRANGIRKKTVRSRSKSAAGRPFSVPCLLHWEEDPVRSKTDSYVVVAFSLIPPMRASTKRPLSSSPRFWTPELFCRWSGNAFASDSVPGRSQRSPWSRLTTKIGVAGVGVSAHQRYM